MKKLAQKKWKWQSWVQGSILIELRIESWSTRIDPCITKYWSFMPKRLKIMRDRTRTILFKNLSLVPLTSNLRFLAKTQNFWTYRLEIQSRLKPLTNQNKNQIETHSIWFKTLSSPKSPKPFIRANSSLFWNSQTILSIPRLISLKTKI